MSKGKNKKEHFQKSKNVFSMIVRSVFYLCFLGIIVFCTICLVNVIRSFSQSQIDQAKAHSEISAQIMEQIKEETKSANKAKPEDENKTDFNNEAEQKKLNSEDENVTNSNNEAEHMVEYLERLQTIQSENSTDSVMSFIFGVLSSILVGLCAWFALKNFQSLEDAKKSAEEADENAKKSEEQYNKSKKEQLIFSKILEILIDISDARIALKFDKKTEATARIAEIEKLTLKLSDGKQTYLINQLQEELSRLESSVDEYEEKIRNDIDRSQARKNSAFIAIKRYRTQIDNAVKHCDKLLKQAESI